MCINLVLLKVYLFITAVNCARILVVNPHPSYSHQVVYNGIAKELSERGHDVVSITTNPMNDKSLKNLREIDTSFTKQTWINTVNAIKPDIFNKVLVLYEKLAAVIDMQLQHPEIQTLIKNETEHFDLVLLSYMSPAIFAFKFRFNCPFIALLTFEAPNSDHETLGNGINSASNADACMFRYIGNTLIRRFYSFCMNSFFGMHRVYVIEPKATETIRNYFGEDYPDSGTLRHDVDLLFVNSNSVLHDPRPSSACTIFIGGGVHMWASKELPKVMKTFLDNSKRGVIYMCFGSNIQSSELPDNVKQIFFKAFADLPYDIMWKYENETALVPKNMFVKKWMPQQDILRHKNIKLFITHGGLQSTEEAIINHVPMLAIPFYADQLHNSHKIQGKKIGLMIDSLDTLTSERLKASIVEVIQNPMYKTNIKRMSAILTDQPMKPMEKVVWWTEYVLRHKGAKHLRGPDLPTYQLYLLDILGILLLLLLILLFALYKILKFAFQKLTSMLASEKIKVS